MSLTGASSSKPLKRPNLSAKFSPVSHKLMTHTPKPETLLNIDMLNENFPGLAESLRTVYRLIYSYVFDREPTDDELTHYVNTAGTAYFEALNQERVQDKNHRIKAGMVFCKIRNILAEINQTLKLTITAEEENCLQVNKSILTVQNNIYVQVLRTLEDDDKEHLKEYSNLNVDELSILPVTPNTKERARTSYTAPESDPRTPTRVKSNDLIGRFVLAGDIKDQQGIEKAQQTISSPVKVKPAAARRLLFSTPAREIAAPPKITAPKVAEPVHLLAPSTHLIPRSVMLKRK